MEAFGWELQDFPFEKTTCHQIIKKKKEKRKEHTSNMYMIFIY
jgi:hypothetical protein